jgi:hypothetical protein
MAKIGKMSHGGCAPAGTHLKNPGVFQATRGTIIKIDTSCITVQAHNGTKIVRAPKNLILAYKLVK